MKNINKQNGYTAYALILILVWMVGFVGWVLNIYKLIATGLDGGVFTMIEVLQVIGIFVAPLGAVLGYIA